MESVENGKLIKWKKEGKYNRKLYQSICVKCGKERFLPKSKIRDLCRECAYIINAFKINSYIKRPNRDNKGRYKNESI